MIHIIIGTKAQYIKMLPVMKELERAAVPFTVIDTGQHASISRGIRAAFNLREPDLYLSSNEEDLASIVSAFFWNLRIATSGYVKCSRMVKRGDYCLVHGDTLSTLQGALIAKLCRACLVHVEAGERTHNIRDPFPEEIIRILVDKLSDICFASSDNSYKNLLRENVRGKVINVSHNTIFDAVLLAEGIPTSMEVPDDYVLVSIHRAETVYSQRRMEIIAETVQEIAKGSKVIWGLHAVTKNSLVRFGLFEGLRNNQNVILRSLLDYISFIKAMRGAKFIVTDGGGPQEESFLLNVPCLLMRMETERTYYKSVFLSGFDPAKIAEFLQDYPGYRMTDDFKFESPSKTIVSEMKKLVEG